MSHVPLVVPVVPGTRPELATLDAAITALRTLVVLRVAALNRATYEFGAYVPDAQQVGAFSHVTN